MLAPAAGAAVLLMLYAMLNRHAFIHSFIASYLTKQDIYHDKRKSDTNEELRMVKQRLDFPTKKSIKQTAALITTTTTIDKLQAELTSAMVSQYVLIR